MKALHIPALVSLFSLVLAATPTACSSSAPDHGTRCADMKRDLTDCIGTGAPDIDCSVLAPADLTRIESAMDTLSCTALGQGVTLDGDPKSASCRLYGVGCVASRTEAPTHAPTRYPIVLVSGIDDSTLFRYSARILSTMRDGGGHAVFVATLPAWSPIAVRAPALWKRIEEVRAETKAAKVNLVCHSLGGLDCRYLVSPAGLHWDLDVELDALAGAVASITTIATAHRGTRAADVLVGVTPDADRAKLIDAFATLTAGIVGSDAIANDPDVRGALAALTTAEALRFGSEITDAAGVYYQSWAGYSRPFGAASAEHDARVLEVCAPDQGEPMARVDHDYLALPLVPFADVVGKGTNGEPIPSDGLIAVESARWGNFRGCIPADHMEQLGQRNLPDANVRTGFDVARFYTNVAADLAARGM